MCTCGAHAYMVEAYEHIPLDLEDYVAHLKKSYCVRLGAILFDTLSMQSYDELNG